MVNLRPLITLISETFGLCIHFGFHRTLPSSPLPTTTWVLRPELFDVTVPQREPNFRFYGPRPVAVGAASRARDNVSWPKWKALSWDLYQVPMGFKLWPYFWLWMTSWEQTNLAVLLTGLTNGSFFWTVLDLNRSHGQEEKSELWEPFQALGSVPMKWGDT